VHHERLKVVSQASRRGGESALVELVDQRLESVFGVALADRVVERLPAGLLDAFAFSSDARVRRPTASVSRERG
jgi:hypothetical protein